PAPASARALDRRRQPAQSDGAALNRFPAGTTMRLIVNALIAATLAAGSMIAAPQSFAADLIEGVYASDPGACSHPSVLARISSRFDHQVRNVPHLPDVSIDAFQRIAQTRYLPAGENRPVERRYCH